MTQATSQVTDDPRRGWIIVVMMFLFMLVNFADKSIIGLAAVSIIKDLNLTNEQFGQIGSAFFLLFSISAVVVRFLFNRIPTKLVLTVMALIWAFAQLTMLGVGSLPILMASRIALGAGEGPAYPVALHAVYRWFPNERRAFPTSFVALGGAVGAGFVAPILTWIILTYGRRLQRHEGRLDRRAAVVPPDFFCARLWLSFPEVAHTWRDKPHLARLLGGGCVAVAGVALILLSQATSAFVQIPLVMVSFAVGSVIYTLGPPLVGEISPVHQRGATLGISNALFTLAGLVAPWVMGHIVDVGANPVEGFRNGFLLGGAIIATGGVLAMLLINPERDLARFRMLPGSSATDAMAPT